MIRVLRSLLVVYSVAVVLAVFAGAGANEVVADEKTPENIGADACKKCHFKQHKSWTKSTLASTFESLKPGQKVEEKKAAKLDPEKDYTQDAKCLKCHTTGYGAASGYPEVAEGKEWSDAEKARAALNQGVTCEACHGPGSLYSVIKKENKQYKRADIVAAGAISPPTAETCTPCHVKECPTMGEDYAFDFEAVKKSEKVHDHKDLKYEH